MLQSHHVRFRKEMADSLLKSISTPRRMELKTEMTDCLSKASSHLVTRTFTKADGDG